MSNVRPIDLRENHYIRSWLIDNAPMVGLPHGATVEDMLDQYTQDDISELRDAMAAGHRLGDLFVEAAVSCGLCTREELESVKQ